MKHKRILNEIIYLPDYFKGKISNDLRKCREIDILYWDFTKKLDCKAKMQIELLVNYIAKTIKEKERRNRYLFLLKYFYCYVEEKRISDLLKLELSHEKEYAGLINKHIGKAGSNKFISFCRETLFMMNEEIDWSANVWYVDKLNIETSRLSQGNIIKSFRFHDVLNIENRVALQRYIKYLLTLTTLNIGTIKIFYGQAKSFLRYLEEQIKVISDIDQETVNQYFATQILEKISPQSYNNKIKGVADFLEYLQHVHVVDRFAIRVDFYEKKVHTLNNRDEDLEEQLESFSEYLYDFPKHLCVMSCILLHTGIDKGKLFQLKDTDFYFQNDDSWLKIPETSRCIPIPDSLHLMVLKFVTMKHIPIDSYLFYNGKGELYTYQSFKNEIVRQCSLRGILENKYVFKGNGYQIEFAKCLYNSGVSIQTIREYMGYTSDETVKKNLGIIDEKIMRASEMFYQRTSSIWGGILPVAKYDKMRECNQEENRKKVELAIAEIKKLEAEGNPLSVTELSKNTGLSKAFFYKNENVRSVLDAATERQRNEKFVAIKEEVRKMSLERQVEYYEKKIKALIRENERLQKENAKLKKK